jgi:ArsR family transcriptional regulator, arsenate/arsenite/antimonite-responsive transcriptional repressor
LVRCDAGAYLIFIRRLLYVFTTNIFTNSFSLFAKYIILLRHKTFLELAKAKNKTKGEQELEDFDLVFKALSHPSRRNILTVLQARGGTMNAGDIVNRFSYAWPTMTRHLQQLERAGLITVDKVSREQHYSLNAERLNKVVTNWLKWFK